MHTPVMFPDMPMHELSALLRRVGMVLTADCYARLTARWMYDAERSAHAADLLAHPARKAGTWPEGRGGAA